MSAQFFQSVLTRASHCRYLRRADERNTANLLELKKTLLRCFGGVDRARLERASALSELEAFPGTLPRPLTRAALRALDPAHFRLAEKTDGARFLLLALDGRRGPHRGVFLVDRNMDFFQVRSRKHLLCSVVFCSFASHRNQQVHSEHSLLEEFCSDFASEGPLVLDGEIVQTPLYDASESFHLTPGAPVFVAFDLLSYKGNLCDEPLAKREQALMDVTSRFFQKESASRSRGIVADPRRLVYFPFFLNRKKLFPSSELGQLAKLLRTVPDSGERMYVERDQGSLFVFVLDGPN